MDVGSLCRSGSEGIITSYYHLHVRPNFGGGQFSQIAILKQVLETIFANEEFRVYGTLKFRDLNFHSLLHVGIRENRENYAPRKFGRTVQVQVN